MDRYRNLPLSPEPLREADVIAVPVGEDQRPDVSGASAHRGQLAVDVLVVAGHSGVDDGHLAALLDEIRVDHAVVADAVDARRNLHDGLLPNQRRGVRLVSVVVGRGPCRWAHRKWTPRCGG
jgi:hypothetical protein